MDRTRLLSDIIGAFAEASMDHDALCALISQRLAEEIGDLCSLMLLDSTGERLQLVATHDRDPVVVQMARDLFEGKASPVVPVQHGVLTSGQPRLVTFEIDRAATLTTADRATFAERIGMHCSLVVPLRARGRSIGILNLARHRPDRGAYDADEIELARMLGEHAGTAIANARVLQHKHDELRRAKEAAETTARQLHFANEAVCVANRQLEVFSDSIAHHLKAPLRAIDGFTSVLESENSAGLDEQGRSYLHRVRAASSRMTRIIEDLLAFSRIGQSPPARERFDLTKLARRISYELDVRSPGRPIHVDIAEGLVVDADPRLVRILLEQLLENARKFTTGKSAALVEMFSEDAAGSTVFVVRDNGIGFDMSRAHKLFVPFARLHAAAELDGTGLGLATAQRIVALHDGQIWAEANPGGGATFRFTLAEARLGSAYREPSIEASPSPFL